MGRARILLGLMSLNAVAAIPLAFFAVSLPVMLREAGASLVTIGFVGLVYLPFALSFLWAPWIDRPVPFELDRRRFWMVASVASMSALSLVAAIIGEGAGPIPILALTFAISIGGATLRTALLGLVVEKLPPESRPMGAALVPAGGAMGALFGATGLLLIYGAIGWTGVMTTMAAAMAVLLLPGLMLSERDAATSGERVTLSLRAFFADQANRAVLLLVTPIGAGLGIGLGMIQPRLVDLGFSPEEIGALNGVFTCAAMLTGGPLGAWAVRSHGIARVLPLAVAINAAVMAYAAAASGFGWPRIHAAASVALYFLAFSALSAMTVLLYMERCRPGREGTDFSIFLCLFWMITLVGMVVSGLLAGPFGYAAAFGVGALIVLGALPFVPRLRAMPVETV